MSLLRSRQASDLPERLRTVARVLKGWTVWGDGVENPPNLLRDAADEIQRLEAKLAPASSPPETDRRA